MMKPTEEMALTSLERQGIKTKNNKRILLPSHIVKFEIVPYVGRKKWNGGRTKDKIKKTSRNNRRKTRKLKKREYNK
jgi:hypothetical protein